MRLFPPSLAKARQQTRGPIDRFNTWLEKFGPKNVQEWRVGLIYRPINYGRDAPMRFGKSPAARMRNSGGGSRRDDRIYNTHSYTTDAASNRNRVLRWIVGKIQGCSLGNSWFPKKFMAGRVETESKSRPPPRCSPPHLCCGDSRRCSVGGLVELRKRIWRAILDRTKPTASLLSPEIGADAWFCLNLSSFFVVLIHWVEH